jgi:hypothetical protein
MQHLLKSMSLAPEPEGLKEIDTSTAEKIIEAILWKDLAYGAEIMPKEQASKYALWFVEQYSSQECKLYTNGDWVNYHQKSSNGWHPLTDATFDGGIIIVHPQYAICIWVQDED